LRGLAPHLSINEVVVLPLLDIGHDFAIEEGLDRASERFMVFVVQVPLHRMRPLL
jgi:hypothetical protein